MIENIARYDVDPEAEKIVNATNHNRRTQLALDMSVIVTRIGAALSIAMAGLWFFFQEYDQMLVMAGAMGIIVAGSLLYPILYRHGRSTMGIYILILTFLCTITTATLVLPDTIAVSGLSYATIIIIGYLFLGSRPSLWITGITTLIFVVSIILLRTVAGDWFSPLDDTSGLVIAASFALVVMLGVAMVIRLIIGGQEKASTEAQYANFEIRKRAIAEQEQGEQLRHANLEIETRMAKEQKQREHLQNLVVQLQQTANRLVSAATEIQATASQQVATAIEQDATVTQTVATVEEVRVTVVQTAERAQSVAEASQQSVNISRAGEDTVADTIEGMRLIQQRVESIAETILMLSERTQQIGEIIDTVNALADQSKLLALNASIEAARAGEEGKGFAVVAMEVRQLAEQSREATSRVRDILSDIQKATNTAVMVTEEGSKGADAGMEQVEMAGIAIRELAQTLEEAAQAAMQIAASTHQQTNGMDQLATAMIQIKQASAQTAAGMKQTEQSVRDLMEMAQQLEQASARYQSEREMAL
jgi:methyl-accepting chemotaxis protein